MEKKWIIEEYSDKELIKYLSHVLNINEILSNLLIKRGIKSYNEAKIFFRPELRHLHDPFLMRDMSKSVRRIEKALENKEKILIYGDYDVDGTTAVVVVFSFLSKFTDKLLYYIPDRQTEGYGISFNGIDYAHENGCTLMIALDCGIKADEKIDYAGKKNIDIIVCDHHLPGDELPRAYAILDPKRNDCDYPYNELSGCGIGFKLITAFALKNNISLDNVYKYLDLVAVSIGSDIVPVTGENRILLYYGLKKLNQNPCTGLAAIIKVAGIYEKNIVVNDIVFKIGPRINAAGRIDYANKIIELLLSDDAEKALELAKQNNEFNIKRKSLDASITEQARKMIEQDKNLLNRKSTVLYNPEWHKGVIGIVASKLIEKYFYRPTIILTKSNEFATGSARSIPGFDIYNAIKHCSEYLETFGGHKYAAGITCKIENIKTFADKFEEIVSNSLSDEELIPAIYIDDIIELKNINSKFFNILKQFAPFGPENMKPVFVSKNVFDIGYGKKVGKQEEHLKLSLRDSSSNTSYFDAIAFNMGNFFDKIKNKKNFDICYTIEENEYMGRSSIQLNIKDIKL